MGGGGSGRGRERGSHYKTSIEPQVVKRGSAYRYFALEQCTHNIVEVFVAGVLLQQLAEVTQHCHRRDDRGYELQVISKNFHPNSRLRVHDNHPKDHIQRL